TRTMVPPSAPVETLRIPRTAVRPGFRKTVERLTFSSGFLSWMPIPRPRLGTSELFCAQPMEETLGFANTVERRLICTPYHSQTRITVWPSARMGPSLQPIAVARIGLMPRAAPPDFWRAFPARTRMFALPLAMPGRLCGRPTEESLGYLRSLEHVTC